MDASGDGGWTQALYDWHVEPWTPSGVEDHVARHLLLAIATPTETA